MVLEDKRRWRLANGLQIARINTQWVGGIEEISRVGGTQLDGSPWNSPVGDVIEAIPTANHTSSSRPWRRFSSRCTSTRPGKNRLKAGFDENDARLLRLARCA